MKLLTSLACTLAICTMAARPAGGYEERHISDSESEPYEYNINAVAEAFGYSAVPIPRGVWTCMEAEGAAPGTMRCIAIPPGSVLLIPTAPDSLEVR